MHQSALVNARKLSPAAKRALEDILGRALKDDESVSIRAYEAHEAPGAEVRLAALRGLQRYFAEIDAQVHGVPPEELEAAIDEALNSVRPGYKPIR